jgi:hypothetical protein
MAMVVTVDQPQGTLLPELAQWLPRSALDELIGTITETALRETTSIVTLRSSRDDAHGSSRTTFRGGVIQTI